MAFPLVVTEFFIFKIGHKHVAEEHEKILYFYPAWKSKHDQLSIVGLCEALLSFSNFFSTTCTTLHTRNGKRFFRHIAENLWAVMSVAPVNPLPLGYETCEHIIDDNIVSHKLSRLCERFELLHGPMSVESDGDLKHFHKNAAEFFNRELAMMDLGFHDVPDIMNAIQHRFCRPKSLLSLDNVGTRIQISCQFPNTDVAMFYDTHLAWSSLTLKDFRPVLQFIVSDVLSVPPDLDLASISPKASHMGRFLTGLSDMGRDLCPPQTSIPLLYQRLPDSTYQRIFVVVYRALRLSVCLFIEAKHELHKEFFQSFDSVYGSILTNLSCFLEADHSMDSVPPSDLANLSLNFETSSKPCQTTPSNSSIRGFLLWEPEIASVNTNLFHQHCGGRGEVVPAFASLLPIMCAVRQDVVSCFDGQWSECILKLEPEIWLYFRRFNKREIFLIFAGKKVDISKIMSESKQFAVENLTSLFRVY